MSGKTEDFELFWPKFEAYANLKGFAETLDYDNLDPFLPAVYNVFDTDADVKKKQEAAIMRNKHRIAALLWHLSQKHQ